jgi:ribonuclease E
MSDNDPTSTEISTEVAPAKKAATKKTAVKKAAVKKTAAKKAATKKTAVKKAAVKKTAAKKTAAKKTAAKKATSTKKATSSSPDPVEASGADDEAATENARTRTRTRSRSRRPAEAEPDGVHGARSARASGARDGGAENGGAGNGPSDEASEEGAAESGGPRRRRRGGRGRRGRGRGDAAEGVVQEGPSSEDGADSVGDTGDSGRGPKPAKRAKKASKRGAGAKKSSRESRSGGGEDDADDDESPIARGGTRMAAKKSRRGGGQAGGQGSGQRRGSRPGGVTEEERRTIMAGPPRTMIVTAKPERIQIAVMEERTLVEHYVTRDEDVTFVGNIYMGRVQNVLPGMEAAFIDIGKGRNGVLYAGEVLYDELDLEEESDQRIENVLKPGQKVLVQVTKDPMGTKGPRLTMHLSLAGRYVVLAPDSDLFGISRKLTDAERDRLRSIVKAAKPAGHGVIVRTAAEGATEDALTADVERLVERWRKVEEAAKKAKPLDTVYEEPKLVVKVIRDIFGPDFVRCIVDDDALHAQVHEYLSEVAPDLVDRIELYGAPTDDERSQAAGAPSLADAEEAARAADSSGQVLTQPTAAERRRDLADLFTAFDVTDQLRQAMNRKVWLPSGGYLIIESTEAMKVIDVNTGRFTGGNDSNLEEVVLKTNLEAADEIVRQLRLRDMGGMVIIDFIDMLLRSNQEQVVRRLKRELLRDRTKTRVSDVSRLGLVQMTRKNVSQGLVESFSSKCDTCDGHGFVTNLT